MLKSSLNYAQIQRKAALTMPFGRIQVQRMRTSGAGQSFFIQRAKKRHFIILGELHMNI
jgi:hypothetical protein